MDLKNLQDIYPLAPAQDDELFRTATGQAQPETCDQWICSIEGDLELTLFEQAWQVAVDTNPILRTFFVWKRLDKPHQIVLNNLSAKVDYKDWRSLDLQQQDSCVTSLITSELEQGFDPGEAPLTRLALCRVSDREYRLLWSYHRLVLDGISAQRIWNEVFDIYGKMAAGKALEARKDNQFKHYVSAIRQEGADDKEFWSDYLRDIDAASSRKKTPTDQPSNAIW